MPSVSRGSAPTRLETTCTSCPRSASRRAQRSVWIDRASATARIRSGRGAAAHVAASAGGRRRRRRAMIRQPFRTSPLLSAPTGTSISGNTVASSSRTMTATGPASGDHPLRQRQQQHRHRRHLPHTQPVVGDRVAALCVGPAPPQQQCIPEHRRQAGADDAPVRDRPEVQAQVDGGRGGGDQRRHAGAAADGDADVHDQVAAVEHDARGQQRHHRHRPLGVLGQEVADVGRRRQADGDQPPAHHDRPVRQHRCVRALGLVVALLAADVVRERRPRGLEGAHQHQHRHRHARGHRVGAQLLMAGQPLHLDAIGQVQRPQRDVGRHQRQRVGEQVAQHRPVEAADADRVAACDHHAAGRPARCR